MSDYQNIRLEHSGHVHRLILSRPAVHNAFNIDTIREITEAVRNLSAVIEQRVLVIAAEGPTFCAGADFNWMRTTVDRTYEENVEDAGELYDMFETIYTFPHPVVARVQGGAFGGGAGMIACCDLAVMADNAKIAFSEVRIGLVPATISPFVFRKIGPGPARELFLTGSRITAARALELGLVNRIVPESELDGEVSKYVKALLSCGPEALQVTKGLLRDVPALSLKDARDFTAKRIATQRVSEEGQEGMKAFLEKRKPVWTELV